MIQFVVAFVQGDAMVVYPRCRTQEVFEPPPVVAVLRIHLIFVHYYLHLLLFL